MEQHTEPTQEELAQFFAEQERENEWEEHLFWERHNGNIVDEPSEYMQMEMATNPEYDTVYTLSNDELPF